MAVGAAGPVIKIASNTIIGIIGSTAVKIASGISEAASGYGAGNIYITNKGLQKGISASKTIASLFKIKLS